MNVHCTDLKGQPVEVQAGYIVPVLILAKGKRSESIWRKSLDMYSMTLDRLPKDILQRLVIVHWSQAGVPTVALALRSQQDSDFHAFAQFALRAGMQPVFKVQAHGRLEPVELPGEESFGVRTPAQLRVVLELLAEGKAVPYSVLCPELVPWRLAYATEQERVYWIVCGPGYDEKPSPVTVTC